MNRIRIALVGVGYWGPNLARNVAQSPGATLVCICDRDSERAQAVAALYPSASVEADLAATLVRPDIDAIVLATPSGQHFAQAKAALEAGKHVLVEKPLAHSAAEAATLGAIARQRGRVLMVGHTFLFNNIVHDVKRRIDGGDLGNVLYVYAQRLNLGRFRTDSDVVWTLAPHDISILNLWFGSRPERVSARGHTYIHPNSKVAEVAFVNFEYSGGRVAHLHLSWLDPQKRREMVVVGSERMLVYDDMNSDAHIRIYDKRAEAEHQSGNVDFADFTTRLRAGDLVIPNIRLVEPLKAEITHFVECIAGGKAPRTDATHGTEVVAALEAASRSMTAGGESIAISYPQ